MNHIERKYNALRFLATIGWQKDDLILCVKERTIDVRIGSPLFLNYWNLHKNDDNPKLVLHVVLKMAKLPEELSGAVEETKTILENFHPDLEPSHLFWGEFAAQVNQAFPVRSLGEQGTLQKGLHQFRYIISSQQAQYVRNHFKKEGMSDAQALMRYLRKKRGPFFWRKQVDYSFKESSRLHNKLKFEKNCVLFPDNEVSYNMKLLMNFHTEFILDSYGHFLNETDAETVTERGVINGASFNYGTQGKRHWDLDVDPIRRHDPQFRRTISKGYRSPKLIMKRWYNHTIGDFDHSYFNGKGYYGYKGRSPYRYVKKQSCYYKWKIRLLKLWHFRD
ncbi:DUF3114 domain-containing protein [Streptococcus hongkongensis]|nr:hypothetical protein NC01_02150 [Streptococcus uberis]